MKEKLAEKEIILDKIFFYDSEGHLILARNLTKSDKLASFSRLNTIISLIFS